MINFFTTFLQAKISLYFNWSLKITVYTACIFNFQSQHSGCSKSFIAYEACHYQKFVFDIFPAVNTRLKY